ncbi:glycerol-3-phosphate dehydrogenase [Enterovirga sp.]|uniref:glycerol-3-phosphate dehydrogenase n=1 Tax=Enterovirga sp. TaxID=2026350 RepID=UPI002C67B44F|nr:glycerol-3-phosphate dehydrogenase [Enterovirga sp.]HMO30013.1 glycerol-3-phosphate dehydrogenase [Enterovirga sp.]
MTSPPIDSSVLYDIAVIGGGINGCGIARDAAGRGLTVFLCEQGDLAEATSSASTKLIHGGLRYLEHREFRLVREALSEREVLWAMAPHIIRPARFVLPHHKGLRPAWLLRLGLFLYDHLGGRRRLPGTRTLRLDRDPAGLPLKPGRFRLGFEYSDCRVDDARLVVLNARDAALRGAEIRTRARAVAAERDADEWRITVENVRDGARGAVRARALVNAAGPWADHLRAELLGIPGPPKVRLVQGSHIVVPRLPGQDACYVFQTGDGRIVFALPYEDDFTLIGTTDRDYEGDPAGPQASAAEIDYLCLAASQYLAAPIRPADVVWSYAGIRPLYDDGNGSAQDVTRDYVLALDAPEARAPALTVYGGKITTYRRLAQEALGRLAASFPQASGPWTAGAPLPGGDMTIDGLPALEKEIARRAPWLGEAGARRLVRLYGTEARAILGEARGADDLGRAFGGGLTEAELVHLMDREWAETAQDVIWRRTKLGLVLDEEQVAAIESYMLDRAGL